MSLLVGCDSQSKPASRERESGVRARPLALQPDGIIDPARVDLSGTAGVSPAEQRRAEDLLRGTIRAIQRWNDVARAEADGFVSIGDGFSGTEHFVHWDWIDDGRDLDPSRPESLVYRVDDNGRRVLEAAMYVLPARYTLSTAPNVGGRLTQFHIHDNLCFTDSAKPRFVRLTWNGTCHRPLVKALVTPMLHVWIRPNPCGPFALIGQFVRGTIAEGERAFCDSEHGHASDHGTSGHTHASGP